MKLLKKLSALSYFAILSLPVLVNGQSLSWSLQSDEHPSTMGQYSDPVDFSTGAGFVFPTVDTTKETRICFLTRIGFDGEVLWKVPLGVLDSNRILSVKLFSDGGVGVAGWIGPISTPRYTDVFIKYLNPSGKLIWSRFSKVSGFGTDYRKILPGPQGGLLVVSGDSPFHFTSFNSKGDSVGNFDYFRPGYFLGKFEVVENAGYVGVFYYQDSIRVEKWNLNGKISDSRFYKINQSVNITDLGIYKDNGLVISGYFRYGIDSSFSLRLKPNGDSVWFKTSMPGFRLVAPLSDGGFIFAKGGGYISLMRLDSNWNTAWNKDVELGLNGVPNIEIATLASNGDLFLGGDVRLKPFTNDSEYVWVAKITTTGLAPEAASAKLIASSLSRNQHRNFILGATLMWEHHRFDPRGKQLPEVSILNLYGNSSRRSR